MIVFLTSSPTGDLDGKYTCEGFDSRNGFNTELIKVWKDNSRVLMITAFPDDKAANEDMGRFFYEAILKTGLSCEQFDMWDSHILECEDWYSKNALQSYDVIILGGGHVPTQMEFFRKLNLTNNIKGFNGIVIGISAGSMNSAEMAYSQPEEPGEALDPNYQRVFSGLGITKINILPHYQMIKDSYLDGMRVYEDIVMPDSYGREFIVIPDGSFVIDYNGPTLVGKGKWIETDVPSIHGEAYLLKDGKIMRIS